MEPWIQDVGAIMEAKSEMEDERMEMNWDPQHDVRIHNICCMALIILVAIRLRRSPLRCGMFEQSRR